MPEHENGEHCNVDCAKLEDILNQLSSALDSISEEEAIYAAAVPCARAALLVAKVYERCCGQDDNGNGED